MRSSDFPGTVPPDNVQIVSAPKSLIDHYEEKLKKLISDDLNFHNEASNSFSHDFHAFPAKFPPQLPRKFIQGLTEPGDIVLDPMMGSGTTLLEAHLTGRRAIGVDIDPLALKIGKSKVTSINKEDIWLIGKNIVHNSSFSSAELRSQLESSLGDIYDAESVEFINKWFAKDTQIELLAILNEIQKITDDDIRIFFEIVLSAIIITKSGGVTLAYDLAHTRPHLAKGLVDKKGRTISLTDKTSSDKRSKLLTKTLRSAITDFEKRFRLNLKNLPCRDSVGFQPMVLLADAQHLPLQDGSVDLIVTSPPYASNAIDYMRAHKFSLVWLGYPVNHLSRKRKDYIGGEAVRNIKYDKLPEGASKVVLDISKRDEKKGLVLHRYYSEMTRSLKEMFRVMRPGKAAIVVVGSSIMRGRDTEIHTCLAEIGKSLGFKVTKIGVRKLDRNRRLLPAGTKINRDSQIQKRMHEEYVIGFYKARAEEIT